MPRGQNNLKSSRYIDTIQSDPGIYFLVVFYRLRSSMMLQRHFDLKYINIYIMKLMKFILKSTANSLIKTYSFN